MLMKSVNLNNTGWDGILVSKLKKQWLNKLQKFGLKTHLLLLLVLNVLLTTMKLCMNLIKVINGLLLFVLMQILILVEHGMKNVVVLVNKISLSKDLIQILKLSYTQLVIIVSIKMKFIILLLQNLVNKNIVMLVLNILV